VILHFPDVCVDRRDWTEERVCVDGKREYTHSLEPVIRHCTRHSGRVVAFTGTGRYVHRNWKVRPPELEGRRAISADVRFPGSSREEGARVSQTKMSIRTFVATGDLPSVQEPSVRPSAAPAFQQALGCSTAGETSKFRTIYNLFVREVPTDMGRGTHYLYGLVGSAYAGARETVYAVAEHQGLSVLDLTTIRPRALQGLPIRDLVKYILTTPPRCAILVALDADSTHRMHKVLAWFAKQQLDIRYRRVVFCLSTTAEVLPEGIQSTGFPGSTNDKVQMLLFRVPTAVADLPRLRRIAQTMTDYAVLEPRLWRLVDKTSTLDVLLSTLAFQVHCRSHVDVEPTLDSFPSFEAGWRRRFSADLQCRLRPPPKATCQGLHRVVPAGVSPEEALRCIQTALPPDLTDSYALTVASHAVDDQGGSIVISQKTQHLVVTIQCTVDPGILSAVCSELRTGHRLMTQELSKNKVEMTDSLTALNGLVTSLQGEIQSLKDLLVRVRDRGEKKDRERAEPPTGPCDSECSKKTCTNPVRALFVNGKRKKQCSTCIAIGNRSRRSTTCGDPELEPGLDTVRVQKRSHRTRE